MVCIGSRAPHCRTVLQNGQDNPPKKQQQTEPEEQSIYHEILGRTSSRFQAFEKLLWKPTEKASQ